MKRNEFYNFIYFFFMIQCKFLSLLDVFEDGSKRSDFDFFSYEYINFILEYVLKFKNIEMY